MISGVPRREREIFEILCSAGEATAAEVRERMIDAPSYLAVRTLLGRLEAKGLVTHPVADQAFVYRSVPQAEAVKESALQQLVKNFFSCRNQRLRVEIVTPLLGAAAITGGGSVQLALGLPPRDRLALAITGGGRIVASHLRAGNAAASIKGGGTIHAGTPRALAAAIHGGGCVRYSGDPAKTVSVHGGGTVTRSCPR